jgi:hypothetical protein
MNAREKAVKERYEAQGYTVMTRGWPDLLVLRTGAKGKIEGGGVEIKRDASDLPTKWQRRMHKALRKLGVGIRVEYAVETGVNHPLAPIGTASASDFSERLVPIDVLAHLWGLSIKRVLRLLLDYAGPDEPLLVPESVVLLVHSELTARPRSDARQRHER